MIGAAVVSGVVHWLVVSVLPDAMPFLHIQHDDLPVGQLLGAPAFLNIGFYLSLLTVAAGFLSGRGGLWFGAGGFLCYWFLAPLLFFFASAGTQEIVAEGPGSTGGLVSFGPTGIGLLIGAALGGIRHSVTPYSKRAQVDARCGSR